MTAPVYDPPRGRNSYLAYVIACAVGIVVVAARYALDLAASVRSGLVSVPVRTAPTAEVPQPPGGATVRADQLVLQVRTDDVPGGAIGLIRTGDALEVVLVAALIGLVAAVAWTITRGALFDRSATVVLGVLAGMVVVAGFVPSFVRRMGWNWVVSGLGWDGRLPEPVVDPPYVAVYLGLLLVICFRFALTAAQRMVRDQSGLV
ncbi:hypothetical protein [Curtobacterium sp. MCBD17_032]|uniref:hypothetical protein n=1 Tax=Curtobacterium sp. MCBD17_032 TaxID=2175659 RepID=UPI000DA6DF53|nr:hypothetical protein [Curtobacterium sp. MCBD17_032]PZE80616.1 hypothetical protein DEI91_13825 [Curtobacterium sp. MCBD17_032]